MRAAAARRTPCARPKCKGKASGKARYCSQACLMLMRPGRPTAAHLAAAKSAPTASQAASTTGPAFWLCSPEEFYTKARERRPDMHRLHGSATEFVGGALDPGFNDRARAARESQRKIEKSSEFGSESE